MNFNFCSFVSKLSCRLNFIDIALSKSSFKLLNGSELRLSLELHEVQFPNLVLLLSLTSYC